MFKYQVTLPGFAFWVKHSFSVIFVGLGTISNFLNCSVEESRFFKETGILLPSLLWISWWKSAKSICCRQLCRNGRKDEEPHWGCKTSTELRYLCLVISHAIHLQVQFGDMEQTLKQVFAYPEWLALCKQLLVYFWGNLNKSKRLQTTDFQCLFPGRLIKLTEGSTGVSDKMCSL